jgi:hypothetical protein
MQWVCDTCGMHIRNADEGYVEWQNREEDEDVIRSAPRIVHARPSSPKPYGCQYDQDEVFAKCGATVGDLSLSELVGPSGLVSLLEFVSEGYFGLEPCLDLIQRVHVPDYDLVRNHFEKAISEGVIEPSGKPGYYDAQDIESVKSWLAERQDG